MRSVLGAVLALGCVAACAPCKPPADALASLRQDIDGPQATLDIPLATLDRLLARRIHGLAQEVLRPKLLPLALYARVQDARFLEADGDGVWLAVVLALHTPAQTPLLALRATLRLQPRLVGQALVLGLGPRSLERLEPLGGSIEDRALEALPAALRPLAAQLGRWLATEAHALLRRTLLVRLGDVARLSTELPLPLRAVRVSTRRRPAPHLHLALTSRLPARPLAEAARACGVRDASSTVLSISGSLLAALANCALQQGVAPAAYGSSFTPEARGLYTPRFDWRAHEPRPLKILVSRIRRPCVTVQLGARPMAAVVDRQLVVGLRDGRLERASGSWVARLALWARGMPKALQIARSLPASVRVNMGGQTLRLALRSACAANDRLVVTTELAKEAAAAAAAPRAGELDWISRCGR